MEKNTTKHLLILERSNEVIQTSKGANGEYILEGVFTEIGVKNKNNRIYDEKEILPHIKELQEKAKKRKLVGELDHPKQFEVSLRNVSHLIEELNYDESKKIVTGRILLLNTDPGKQAKALVDAGVPLHISSRAAGIVESNGHVKIKKMFTYDLVADPGFENAELKRVNESFGLPEDDNIQIYEFVNGEPPIDENDKNNKVSMVNENANQFVSKEDFQEYSEKIKEQFEAIQKFMKSGKQSDATSKEDQAEFTLYVETIAKNLNKVSKVVENLRDDFEDLVSHNNYIIDGLESVKDYSERVALKTDQGIEYAKRLAESHDKHIEWTKIIGLKLDENIEYGKLKALKIDQTIEYLKEVAKTLDGGLEYMKLIAEKTDQNIEYGKLKALKIDQTIEFVKNLTEELDNRFGYQTKINEATDDLISHQNYGITKLEQTINFVNLLKESIDKYQKHVAYLTETINGAAIQSTPAKPVIESNDEFKKNISSKLDLLIESHNAKIAKDNEDKQNQTIQKLNESKTQIQENETKLNWLNDMPEKYKEQWEKLDESRKNQIIAQAASRVLETEYQIKDFWQTRDLRPTKVNLQPIIETKSTYTTPSPYMQAVQEGLDRRFRYIVNKEQQ